MKAVIKHTKCACHNLVLIKVWHQSGIKGRPKYSLPTFLSVIFSAQTPHPVKNHTTSRNFPLSSVRKIIISKLWVFFIQTLFCIHPLFFKIHKESGLAVWLLAVPKACIHCWWWLRWWWGTWPVALPSGPWPKTKEVWPIVDLWGKNYGTVWKLFFFSGRFRSSFLKAFSIMAK